MSEAASTDKPDAQQGEQAQQQEQGEPADKPLGENGEKALKAERDARSLAEKKATELQKRLDAINQANESAVEKAQRELAEAQAAANAATTEALRLRVAAKHGISDEDADLFLTGSDLETVEKQAVALAARTATGPKPDLSQGSKGQAAGGSPEQDFANFIGAQLGR